MTHEKICLVCNGSVWGTARYKKSVIFKNELEFNQSFDMHMVNLGENNKISNKIKNILNNNKIIFGWLFDNFYWYPLNLRPKSGINNIPEFKGQKWGQVWCTNLFPNNI